MKRLYVVTFTYETMAYAETAEDALVEATGAWADDDPEGVAVPYDGALPKGWAPALIPYGSDYQTVEEILRTTEAQPVKP